MTLLISPSDYNLPKLSPKAIVFFNLQHLFMFKEMVKGGKIKSYGPAKRFSYDFNGETITAIGGMIGAPLAVLNVENMISGGTRNILTFGSAGWLNKKSIPFGTVFSPNACVDETGMASDYGSPSQHIGITTAPNNIPVCGKIVSINSFYRTSLKKVEAYREQQIDLIDMEAAPLHYIVPVLKGNLRSIFIISDQFCPSGKWQNGMRTTEYQAGVESNLQKLNILF